MKDNEGMGWDGIDILNKIYAVKENMHAVLVITTMIYAVNKRGMQQFSL
jgi:hypothetical protein